MIDFRVTVLENCATKYFFIDDTGMLRQKVRKV